MSCKFGFLLDDVTKSSVRISSTRFSSPLDNSIRVPLLKLVGVLAFRFLFLLLALLLLLLLLALLLLLLLLLWLLLFFVLTNGLWNWRKYKMNSSCSALTGLNRPWRLWQCDVQILTWRQHYFDYVSAVLVCGLLVSVRHPFHHTTAGSGFDVSTNLLYRMEF